MTPLELIEDGINRGDLQQTAAGFHLLTGRVVKAAEDPAGNPALVEALRWYADRGNYSLQSGSAIAVLLDEGARARAVIPAGKSNGSTAKVVPKPVAKAAKGRKVAKRSSATKESPGESTEESTGESAAVVAVDLNEVFRIAPRNPQMSWQVPKGNKFRDDLTVAADDIKSTKWICSNVSLSPRRPPLNDPVVTIPCDGCGRDFKLRRSEVRRKKSDKGDNDYGTENICQRCLVGGRVND